MKLTLFTDGGARGNPGPAALGVVIKNSAGEVVKAYGRYLGETTNNRAEYHALLSALQTAHALGGTEITCYLDSELVVQQMKGVYKVRDHELAKLFVQIWNLKQQFKKVSFTHVPRSRNTLADAQVNKAIDAHFST